MPPKIQKPRKENTTSKVLTKISVPQKSNKQEPFSKFDTTGFDKETVIAWY